MQLRGRTSSDNGAFLCDLFLEGVGGVGYGKDRCRAKTHHTRTGEDRESTV